MRIETTDEGRNVWFRQSWFNDAMRCPDRGRRIMLDPEPSVDNQYTAMGTGLHAGIEAAARGEALSPKDLADIAVAKFDSMPKIYVDDGDQADCHRWLKHWATLLTTQPDFLEVVHADNAMIEHEFDIAVATRREPDESFTTMRWTGHWDALLPGLRLYDWKTSSRKYRRWELQRWSVQPTFYTEAARQLGLLPSPSEFRYIVCQRNAKQPIDVVTVHRDVAWTGFATEQCWRFLDLHDKLQSWPLGDDGWWCSEKWCPYWYNCKGLYVKPDFTPEEREKTC